MALVTHKFKLDLTPGAARQVLYTSQGDIGRPFEADLYWNGSPWTATGTTANIRGKKQDDTVFDYTATVSGSSVTFSTTEQMTIISGPVECELVFSNDGDIIASANFVLMVEDSPYNPDALSESDIPTIGDLIEQTIGGDIRDEVDALITENPELMLQDNAVTTPKLADDAVTLAKLDEEALQYVSPYKYGAVGDGVTDDSAAVREAGQYGTIREPNGTFYLGSSVILPHGTKDTKYFVEINSSVIVEDDTCGNEFYKDVSQASTTSRGQWLVVARNKRGISLEHNLFHDCVSALYVDTCPDANISKNSFYDIPQTAGSSGGNGYGVCVIASNRSKITCNTFLNVSRHSVYLSKDSTPTKGNEDIIVDSNIFKWDENRAGDFTGFDTFMMCRSTKRLKINNNIFYGGISICNLSAQVDNGSTMDTNEDTQITNNVCYNMANSSRPYDGLIKTLCESVTGTGDFVKKIYVAHNAVYNCHVPMFDIDVVDSVVVENNYFEGDAVWGFMHGDFGALAIKNISIKNNIINTSQALLYFGGNTGNNYGDIEISGNTLKISRLASLTTSAIDTLTITNNNFTWTTDGPSYVDNTTVTTAYICGNVANKTMLTKFNMANATITQTDSSIGFDVTQAAYSSYNVKKLARPCYPAGTVNGNQATFQILANLAALPTTDISLGQIATTADGNVYVYSSSGWKQINNT